jgi:hypothetical protein
MTLPPSGTLSISQINSEFNRGNNLNSYRGTAYYIPTSPTPSYFPSGTISISNFYGTGATSPVVPGNATYNTPGTYTLTLPLYNTIIFQVWGAGGGGAVFNGYTYWQGNSGGNSSIAFSLGTIVGGGGGAGLVNTDSQAGGSGSGPTGTTIINGNSTSHVNSGGFTYGGNSGGPASSIGGGPTIFQGSYNGFFQQYAGGGGGQGVAFLNTKTQSASGGAGGGYASYTLNTYVPQTITINVGSPGVSNYGSAANGGGGYVYISWS